jgi:hypothetical protein
MLTPEGEFVPCRSSRLGFALPQIGGAVGQAFPCFFLNATLPGIARRHWLGLREDLAGPDFRRRLWPIDVGNYRFTRASSYAATAVAARELGDDEVAERLLAALDEDCPRRSQAAQRTGPAPRSGRTERSCWRAQAGRTACATWPRRPRGRRGCSRTSPRSPTPPCWWPRRARPAASSGRSCARARAPASSR